MDDSRNVVTEKNEGSKITMPQHTKAYRNTYREKFESSININQIRNAAKSKFHKTYWMSSMYIGKLQESSKRKLGENLNDEGKLIADREPNKETWNKYRQ